LWKTLGLSEEEGEIEIGWLIFLQYSSSYSFAEQIIVDPTAVENGGPFIPLADERGDESEE
jgi:hypothetical protein